VALVKEAPIRRLAFAMEPGRQPVAEEDLDEAARTPAIGADFVLFARNPLFNCTSVQKPVAIGFLGF